MASISRRIAYNVAVASAAKFAGTALALIGIGFITRYLGKEGFGEYSTVLAFFSFFGAVADLGLYAISTREISRPDSRETEILGNVFAIRLAVSFGIILVAPFIAFLLPYPASTKLGIVLVAFAYFFSSGYSVLIGLFQKRLAMDKVAISEFIGRVFQVGAIIVAVQLRLGFIAVISALLLNMVISFILIYAWSRRYVAFQLKFDWTAWKDFLKESYPVGISAIITFAYFKLDTILLSVMKTSADVGIYNAAYKILENIAFFPAMLMGLVMPIMSRFIFHEKRKFIAVADNTFKIIMILVVPLILGALFLAPDLIRMIGGDSFTESVPVLRVLSFAMAFIFLGNFFTNILIAGNMQKKLMKILSFCALFNIGLNLILIPKYSYLGAAATSSLTEMLVAILSGFLAVKALDYQPKLAKSLYIAVAGAVMAMVLYFFKDLNFFFLATASVFSYFILLWLFQVISTEELKSLIGKKEERSLDFDMTA